jgi:hypothetical protein
MTKAVQLNTLVAEACDPTALDTDLEFGIQLTKAATAQTRENWEGWLDEARTVRVKAYIPAGHPDPVTKFSIENDRRKDAKAPTGVTRSKDGKVNVVFLERGDIFAMLYLPVNAAPIATVKLVRE